MVTTAVSNKKTVLPRTKSAEERFYFQQIYLFSGTTFPIPGMPVSQSFGPPVPERLESVGRSVSTQEAKRTVAKNAETNTKIFREESIVLPESGDFIVSLSSR